MDIASAYENGNTVNETLIVSAGEKQKNVGRVDMTLVEGEITATVASYLQKINLLSLLIMQKLQILLLL